VGERRAATVSTPPGFSTTYWIGLVVDNYLSLPPYGAWTDGSSSTYRYWDIGQPITGSFSYLHTDVNGTATFRMQSDGSNNYYYICKRPLSRSYSVELFWDKSGFPFLHALIICNNSDIVTNSDNNVTTR